MNKITSLYEHIKNQPLEEIQNDIVNLKIDDSVAILELNNKKTLNALTTEMIIKLSFILDKLNKSKKIKVVIITSNLEKVFCAGADIKNLNDVKTLNRMLDSDFDLMRHVLFKFQKPIIACVNEIALGGGFELALACDMIIALEKTKFGFPEIKLGVFPCLGGTLIVKKLGKYLASQMIFTGE